jgi:hypothetical protein
MWTDAHLSREREREREGGWDLNSHNIATNNTTSLWTPVTPATRYISLCLYDTTARDC